MATWKHQLDLSPVFHDDDLSLEQKTMFINDHITSRPWFKDLYYFGELEGFLEEMIDAGKEDNAEEFDAIWDSMYDIFDAERVWVKTR